MFGFGKKKEYQPTKIDLLPGTVLEFLHNTQKEILDELDEHLVSSHGSTFEHSGTMYFFSGKVAIHIDYMAYVLGFIHGVCQSYGLSQEQQQNTVVRFVNAYDKTIENHTKAFNIPSYPQSFADLFLERWDVKTFMEEEGASSELLLGMAEGKDWADADSAIQEDYSKLQDMKTTEKLKVEGFKGLINSWKLNLMLNEEAMALIKMPQHWNDEQIDAELKRQGII